MALERIFILLTASNLILGGDDFAGVSHVALFEGTPQAVDDHRVEQLRVAHAQSIACARQQIRRVAHRFHAASHRHVDVAGGDALRGEHHGFEA